MGNNDLIQFFGDKKVRTSWDPEKEKWFFSIVDVCGVLTDQPDYDGAKNYWKVLKFRLKAEGNESVTNCNQLKMVSPKDGKRYKTDVADMQQMFRIIQSIPSPKAEPFKQWMAEVAARRVDQMQDPELNFEQAYADYRRLGYSDKWINQRLKSIEVRKELTDEWDRAGVKEGQQYASLTDIITQAWSGKTTRQYKQYKGLSMTGDRFLSYQDYRIKLVRMRLSNSGCPSSLTLSLRIIQAMLRASVRIVCMPSSSCATCPGV